MKNHNHDKKVLVTGGAGYIGVVQIEELLEKGYAVKVLDTLYWGEEPLKHLKDRIEIIQADIRDVDPSIVKDVWAVIHHAGLSNDPMAEFNPKANFEINTEATKRFAKLCKENGIQKFTFASSASIYDKGLLAEDVLQDENSKVEPKAAYSLSKYKAEQELLKLADKDFCPVIFRQGTVYGFSPRMRYDLVVNTMLKTALMTNKLLVFCGGEQWRPLIDVRDVAQAHIVALEAPKEKVCGQIFNLVYKNYRVLELAHWVRKALREIKGLNPEIEVDYSPRRDRSYRISGEKIKKVLNWEPKISVEESLKGMIKKIEEYKYTDFMNPKYYNIEWMKLLSEVVELQKKVKRVF
ncbi:MAG: NAD-dependent epimerase/dehydratase family protein [Microgenomates group bacterium]|nr:NAD-dependent epimerase/dehydratase family protein [Microgenomates group bacterium]